MHKLALALFTSLALVLTPRDPDPLRVGVLATHAEDAASPDHHYVEGARLVAQVWNERGGVAGVPVEVVVLDATDVRGAVKELKSMGAVAVLGPLEPALCDEAVRHAKKDLLCVTPHAGDDLPVLRRLIEETYRTTRVGVLHDKSRSARAFLKEFEAALSHPFELVFDDDFGTKPDDLAEALAEDRPQVLVLDGDAAAVRDALAGPLADVALPLVMTARCRGDALRASPGEALIALARSPLTSPQRDPLVVRYQEQVGDPGFGACEGMDGMEYVLRAIAAAESTKPSHLREALDEIGWGGTRGNTRLDAKTGVLDAPLALWSLRDGRLAPHTPPVASTEAVKGASTTTPLPDPDFGEPFANRRSVDFTLDEDCIWVLFGWGTPEESTIDDDLQQLGLSTGGEVPLLDHLVKEELMARILSITSSKFRRNLDGTAIPGESLLISFATHLPEKTKRRDAWTAVFAGDDEAAGGRAFGTRAEIYSVFIRRTIFQPHALEPPLGPDDLTFLDGSYRHGTDRVRDKRSEVIRSLINAYAGSMSLTAAHEIGHNVGLDHITDDPAGIMNVEEGAGLDYRDAHFTPGSFAIMEERLGVAEE